MTWGVFHCSWGEPLPLLKPCFLNKTVCIPPGRQTRPFWKTQSLDGWPNPVARIKAGWARVQQDRH